MRFVHDKAEHRRKPRLARRGLLGVGLAGVAGLGAWDVRHWYGGSGSGSSGTIRDAGTPNPASPRLIGDGSTADTGPQPGRPEVTRLEPGERPPQFVVVSWDGAAALDDGLFPRFLKLAKKLDAHMTFFLSGLYLLPESRKSRYRPPMNPAGASDIGYLSDDHIRTTLEQIAAAWKQGHEIGTHFNGHFCSGSGSVAKWTPEMWRSEIDQAVSFVTEWRTNTGFKDLDPLPFDYGEELVGGRTPCLLGQDALLPTAKELGWRYDASSPGGTQVWPRRKQGLWDLPLQAVPFPGHDFEALTMDYNFMANQSDGSGDGDPAARPAWREQARGAYRAGFRRAYGSNRAPLFLGNHFESWNGGIYMDAVEEALLDMAEYDEVRFVSFRELCDWLDAQSPAVLRSLQGLGVGEAPARGWAKTP
ncbi:hypothetical protein [Streptomyces sp. NPDC054784]